MLVFVPKELDDFETRAAVVPATVQKLVELGLSVRVEAGLGDHCGYLDADYREAGAELSEDRVASLGEADLVLRVRKPAIGEIAEHKSGAVHISFLDPFNEPDLINRMAGHGMSAISLEMIPRTTLAQKMDAISSQANLAGYVAVIMAADRLDRVTPMMMTPSGTLSPCRYFIIGAGVAGLQAIATAKRLGARVDAFDTRPEVEEQVRSVGAKFIKIDLGETGSTEQGYAKELTPEQIEKQRQGMADICARSDVVITTAKLFGRAAPRIITADMVARMRPRSVIVDLAAEGGGNVEGTVVNEEVITANGVKIIGYSNFECSIPRDASAMLGSNFFNLIEHAWDPEAKRLVLDGDDEIVQGCLITHGGAIVHERFREPKEAG